MHLRKLHIFVICTVLLPAPLLHASAWDFNSSGHNDRLSWTSENTTSPGDYGHTQADNMGSPVVTEAGVFFSDANADDPMHFVVDSVTTEIETDDRWVLSTAANPTFPFGNTGLDGADDPLAPNFEFVSVVEHGTYVSADPSTDFGRNQNVFVTIWDTVTFVPNVPLSITFTDDGSGTGGSWVAEAYVDLLPFTGGAGAETIQIDLTNILRVTQAAPSTASITKTSADIYIPEPATAMGLILCVSPLLMIRRSRH